MVEHRPVMLTEVLYFLDVGPGKRFIDATLGGGGHTEAILQSGGEVLGIEQDPKALEVAKRHLLTCPDRHRTVPVPGVFKGILGNFSHIGEIALKEGFNKVDGILFDLGFASFQIDDSKYGLSFTRSMPLEMRLDTKLGVTAAHLINSFPETELAKLFREIGQESRAHAIARAVVRKRALAPLKTTTELANLVEGVYGGGEARIHPATRVFMALRIAVNSEFENLKEGLAEVPDLLKKSGKLVVVSFHSGEDRIVKTFIKEKEKMGIFRNLTTKPVQPSEGEIGENPRSRSGKLRAAEKI